MPVSNTELVCISNLFPQQNCKEFRFQTWNSGPPKNPHWAYDDTLN